MKKFRLSKAFADKWFEALLSRKYRQGRSQLVTINTEGENYYCCLGVAANMCGIPDEAMGILPFVYSKDANIPLSSHETRNAEALFNGYAHLYPHDLMYNGKDEDDDDTSLAVQLGIMNDRGDGFAKIVEWVKENVELYTEDELKTN